MKRVLFLKASATVAVLGWSTAGVCADASVGGATAVDQPADLTEIVVTANKREEKLGDVGMTVAVVSGDELKTAGVTDVYDLQNLVPSLNVGTSDFGYQVFSLRGVNFNAAQISAAPAVSAYVDEAPLPYSALTAPMFLDVQRVEVLEGPQGTLFGENSTGGAINVITAKPTDHLAYGANTEINNFGQAMLETYVSGPVTDTLRARAAFSTTQGGAWQQGYYLNHDKNGDQNKINFRLLLDWNPVEKLKVGVNLGAYRDRSEAQQSQLAQVTPQNPAAAAPGLIGYPIASTDRGADIYPGLDTRVHDNQYQAVLHVDYELTPELTLTSLSNYVNYASSSTRNLDSTALDVISNSPEGDVKTFTQELRAGGNALGGQLKYVGGAYYQKDNIEDDVGLNLHHYSLFGGLPNFAYDDRSTITNQAAAVFGNVDYEFIPKLSFTAGARYTAGKQTDVACSDYNAPFTALLESISNAVRSASGLGPAPPGAFVAGRCGTLNNNYPTPATANYLPILFQSSRKDDNTSWRAGLNYKVIPDTLLYVLVSRGYKAGAYPADGSALNSQRTPISQEELTAYEGGIKTTFLSNALGLNVSGFHYDYRNKQFFSYGPSILGPVSFLSNVPKSKVDGFDMDVVLRPLPGLTLRGAITYIKTEVTDAPVYSNAQNQPLVVQGKEFNFAPPWSGTFDAEYRFPVASQLQAYLGVSGLYNDRTYADLGENPAYRIPAYLILGARAGIESAQGWRVGVFARNVTDKYYWTSVAPGGDTIIRMSGLPLTYGISAAYKF